MNQILNINNNDEQINKTNKRKKTLFFKMQLIISVGICLISIFLYSHMLYRLNKKEELSESLIDNFNISRLYSNNTNYSVGIANETSNTNVEDDSFSVVGLIEINKININYPILSEVNDELLKIAPCKFYGPNPNEIGNLCIAAHNYNSYKFFSNIKDLVNGDIIKIYDLKGNVINYFVYEKKEVSQADLSITSQDTNGLKELTLVTCNNISGKRFIVKARE